LDKKKLKTSHASSDQVEKDDSQVLEKSCLLVPSKKTNKSDRSQPTIMGELSNKSSSTGNSKEKEPKESCKKPKQISEQQDYGFQVFKGEKKFKNNSDNFVNKKSNQLFKLSLDESLLASVHLDSSSASIHFTPKASNLSPTLQSSTTMMTPPPSHSNTNITASSHCSNGSTETSPTINGTSVLEITAADLTNSNNSKTKADKLVSSASELCNTVHLNDTIRFELDKADAPIEMKKNKKELYSEDVTLEHDQHLDHFLTSHNHSIRPSSNNNNTNHNANLSNHKNSTDNSNSHRKNHHQRARKLSHASSSDSDTSRRSKDNSNDLIRNYRHGDKKKRRASKTSRSNSSHSDSRKPSKSKTDQITNLRMKQSPTPPAPSTDYSSSLGKSKNKASQFQNNPESSLDERLQNKFVLEKKTAKQITIFTSTSSSPSSNTTSASAATSSISLSILKNNASDLLYLEKQMSNFSSVLNRENLSVMHHELKSGNQTLERMFRLFKAINLLCSNRETDSLTKIFELVEKFGSTDVKNRLFQFDLFSLDLNTLEKLESILINSSKC
jgi:hypothetical protein